MTQRLNSPTHYFDEVKSILHNEDIEGLIASGAPEDEYDAEAQFLVSEIASRTEWTLEDVVELVAQIWAKLFNRDEQEIALRMTAIRNVARHIYDLL